MFSPQLLGVFFINDCDKNFNCIIFPKGNRNLLWNHCKWKIRKKLEKRINVDVHRENFQDYCRISRKCSSWINIVARKSTSVNNVINEVTVDYLSNNTKKKKMFTRFTKNTHYEINNFIVNFYAQHVKIISLTILIFEKTANRVRTRRIKKRELLMMFIEKSFSIIVEHWVYLVFTSIYCMEILINFRNRAKKFRLL